MAIVVTSIGQTATGSPLTIGSVTVPAGSLIVVCIADKATTGPAGALSDGGSNTYTAITGASLNGSSANGFGRIWYAYNSVALSSATLTYTKAGTNPAAMSAFYATGIQAGADPLDTPATTTATGSSNAPSVTSGTPAASGDLFVGMIARTGTGGAFTQDTGHAWATPPVEAISGTNGTTDARVDGGDFVNSAASALTYAPTYAGTAVGWAALIVAFKVAASGTLAAATGTFTETGSAATFSGKLATVAGSYTEAGNAATFKAALGCVAGAYAQTGNAATFATKFLTPLGTSYTLTGNAVTFRAAINGVVGSFIEAGSAATFSLSWLSPVGTTYTVTGNGAHFTPTEPAQAGSFIVTAYPALFSDVWAPTGAGYTITGYAATLTRDYVNWLHSSNPAGSWAGETVPTNGWTPESAPGAAWSKESTSFGAWTPQTTPAETWTPDNIMLIPPPASE